MLSFDLETIWHLQGLEPPPLGLPECFEVFVVFEGKNGLRKDTTYQMATWLGRDEGHGESAQDLRIS